MIIDNAEILKRPVGRPASKRATGICTRCNEEKERRVWNINGSLVNVDSNGKRWHGLVCPDCRKHNRQTILLRPKQPRTRIPECPLGPKDPLYAMKKRNCIKCGDLMVDRYFSCRICVPHINALVEGF